MPVTANRGEWAELYTLVRILLDNKVPALDKHAKPIRGKFYHFMELIRQESGTQIRFVPYDSMTESSTATLLPSRSELARLNDKFLREILTSSGSSFSSSYGEEIMNVLGITSLKAASSQKIDLSAKLAGLIGSEDAELGFSIKAQLGSPSTLFNAGAHTIFNYKIIGGVVDVDAINAIETKSKYVDRVKAIYDAGAELVFDSINSDVFPLNLDMIETSLQEKLATLIVDSYRFDSKHVQDVISSTAARSSDVNLKNKLTYQIKNFLRAVALGMVPKTPWDGNLSAYGGYLIVDSNGGVGCLHLQNDDTFKDYLIENTKFETPAQKSGAFGDIKRLPNGDLTFSLNLQIKFLK